MNNKPIFLYKHFSGSQLNNNKYNLSNFVNIIYNNFVYLAKYPQLNHNTNEILRLLTSNKSYIITVMYNNLMVAYCITEIMKLQDGRNILFINYLYTGSKYRRHGIASQIIKKMILYAKYKHLDAVILVCDTDDTRVMDFYFKRGFMYDMVMRRYDKYDVITLNL